jgi:hypothetical protein
LYFHPIIASATFQAPRLVARWKQRGKGLERNTGKGAATMNAA